jgi:membrane protein required for beta-lactamase induction
MTTEIYSIIHANKRKFSGKSVFTPCVALLLGRIFFIEINECCKRHWVADDFLVNQFVKIADREYGKNV